MEFLVLLPTNNYLDERFELINYCWESNLMNIKKNLTLKERLEQIKKSGKHRSTNNTRLNKIALGKKITGEKFDEQAEN